MPVVIPGNFGKNLFDRYNEARWLVSRLEQLVLAESNARRKAKGWKVENSISEKRKATWLENTLELLDGRDLAEVTSVIDWIFEQHSGYLPFDVENKYSGKPRVADRRVTNIRLIRDNYDQLVEWKCSGRAAERIDVVERDKPKANYGLPFDDEVQEAQVGELVEDFIEFRKLARCDPDFTPHEAVAWRWAKSFRILLAHKGYAFENIRAVVTNLRAMEEFHDIRAYTDPYNLDDRPGEFAMLLELVPRAEAQQAKEAELAASAARTREIGTWAWQDDDDDDYVAPGRYHSFEDLLGPHPDRELWR